LGPHDGTSLKNIGIDNLHGPGRIFVGSAGNNGNNNFHLDRNFNQNSDSLFTVVNFNNSIESAIENLKLNGDNPSDHFLLLSVKSSGREASSYELTRYASYMTALACDGRKPEVAAAKKYFATKTREAEITEFKSVEPTIKALPTRDAIDYIEAADKLAKLPDSRLTRLLSQMFVSEVALISANQRQIAPVAEVQKQYTTATVRASQLGYTAKQIGNGTSLGKFVKAVIEPDFVDWQGQYKVNHFEVNEVLDARIRLFFARG
jgi:hypothetical protein